MGMLNARLAELTENPDCPYVGGQAEDGNYLLSKTVQAFALSAIPKDGLVSPTDTNMVVLTLLNEKEGNTYPTEDGLRKAIAAGRADKVEAYVDNVKNEPIMTTLPKKGSIKSEVKSDKFDYTIYTLSNGIKVYAKKTDYKKDQVILSAVGKGGSTLYGEKDYRQHERLRRRD